MRDIVTGCPLAADSSAPSATNVATSPSVPVIDGVRPSPMPCKNSSISSWFVSTPHGIHSSWRPPPYAVSLCLNGSTVSVPSSDLTISNALQELLDQQLVRVYTPWDPLQLATTSVCRQPLPERVHGQRPFLAYH